MKTENKSLANGCHVPDFVSDRLKPFYKHYAAPDTLTPEFIEDALKDDVRTLSGLRRRYGNDYKGLLEFGAIFSFEAALVRAVDAKFDAEDMAALYATLSPEFIAALPATMGGFTKEEPGYWFEPEVTRLHPERPTFDFVVQPRHGRYSMAPRFLAGIQIEMEEVFATDPLTPGEVYWMNGTLSRHRSVQPSSVAGWGEFAEIEFDADPRPADAPARYAGDRVGLDFSNKWKHEQGDDFRVFRFIRYAPVRLSGLNPVQVMPSPTDWVDIITRYARYDRERIQRNARRRELYAQKKAMKGKPAAVQTRRPDFCVVWPSRQQRAAA